MPVRARGTSFQATVHQKGQRWRETFKTAEEAREWELEALLALERGQEPRKLNKAVQRRNESPSLCDVLELTYHNHWSKLSSGELYYRAAKRIVEALGPNLAVNSLKATHIDRLSSKMDQWNLSDGTIGKYLAALSVLLNFAYDRGLINRKPSLPKKKAPINRLRYLSPAEEEGLTGFYLSNGYYAMADLCMVAIDTGLRKSELLNLQYGYCQDGVIQLPSHICKTNRFRDVPMTTRVQAIIERRRDSSESDGTLLNKIFSSLNAASIFRLWQKAREHLNLLDDTQFVFHALRHTFCSRLVQRGVPIQVVSTLAGHADITMTMKYAHLHQQNLISAIQVLEV